MDGLSILFGILTVLFLVVVVSMNILGTQAAPSIKSIELDQEGFASGNSQRLTPSSGHVQSEGFTSGHVQGEGFASGNSQRFTPSSRHVQGEGFASASDAGQESKPTLGTKIKKVLDPLALYTNPVQPEGTPIPEGKDLCAIFDKVRQSLTQSIKGMSTSISDGELMKKVEAQLAIDIPGGALNCPLLQYPLDTATDLEWLTWLQTIPLDFGARVVFMSSYADDKLTTVAKSMKDALSGNIELPELSKENFIDSSVCTPMLAEKKRIDQASATCTDPKTMSKEKIEAEVMRILKEIVSEKNRILTSIPLKDRTVTIKDPIKSIRSAKVAAEYLNTQKQKAEAGTLTPTGVNPKLV